ncbi:DUF4105 domain-containing protein [Flavobacterium sp.]|uniref:lipoprotein N-acyltransferase Lnb domain-containing protein n=1 Tax=Flavobacterium sp. TaxID=239 RepID=UPI0025C5468F|nr:DUF4105 domain-containing protein [Flavobacterium sp.]MBA4154170.1 hypothetical protein [Flavobacterium sp.]
MIQKLHFYILLLFISLNGQSLFSQTYPLSPQSKISILTCGSGEELHSIFGHTGIRIQEPSRGIDVVYNFGMFDFSTPNFYLKFVKGDMQYYVANSSFEHFMYSYRMENRSVFEQELNLTTEQKQKLFDNLNQAVFSEGRFYTYKFIDKNCTTMVVDKINDELGKPVIKKVGNIEESYRDVLNPYLANLFYEKLGINIIFGHRTDEKAEQLFLPIELLKSLEQLEVNNKPLAGKTVTLFQQDVTLLSNSWWNTIYTFLLFLVLVVVSNRNWIYLLFLFLLGSLGIFLSLVGFYSLHREVLQNYNVLLFNPFLIGLVYCYIRKNLIWFKRIFYFVLTSFSIYLLFMLNKTHLFQMLPILLTIVIILFKLRKRILSTQ